MLGWMIIVTKAMDEKVELMRWETFDPLIGWLKSLKLSGKAVLSHNGGGYPDSYLVKASDLLPLVSNDGSILSKKSVSLCKGVNRNIKAINNCSDDEMLHIEIWDLS